MADNKIYNHIRRIKDNSQVKRVNKLVEDGGSITHHFFDIFRYTINPKAYWPMLRKMSYVYHVKILANEHSSMDGIWVAGRHVLVLHVINIIENIVIKVEDQTRALKFQGYNDRKTERLRLINMYIEKAFEPMVAPFKNEQYTSDLLYYIEQECALRNLKPVGWLTDSNNS